MSRRRRVKRIIDFNKLVTGVKHTHVYVLQGNENENKRKVEENGNKQNNNNNNECERSSAIKNDVKLAFLTHF